MYCRNCNAQNPENSRYCNYCGAPLSGDCAPPDRELTPPLNNSTAIISLIVNIVIFNIIGLIFAILSLVSYNDYETALRTGNFLLAENRKNASKRYSKISFIVAGIILVVEIVAVIIFFVWTSIFSVGVFRTIFGESINCRI
ncbi:MAG: zinc ribbon domain-containing protein [Clostridiaceae bacterium]|nr:zinc ribbon domain-containing protein [Clostridiaceae bacterium]MDY5990523.1 zinc ribbon domain-containing protein [Oscillospiraceae bacterium]